MNYVTKEIRTDDRGAFIRLFSYLARGIDTKYFHDPDNIFVIGIAGGAGKSLVADVMFKTWMDEYSLSDAFNIPPANKMFFERYPCEAFDYPIEKRKTVAGKAARFCFTSFPMFGHELDKMFDDTFCKSYNWLGGVFAVSHIQFALNNLKKTKPALIIDIQDFNVGDIRFTHTMRLQVLKKSLLKDGRFQTYWNNLDNRERWAGKPAIPALVLAG